MSDQLKKHLESLDDLEILVLLRNTVNACIRDYKKKENAVKAEVDYGFNRKGVRGGKYTTLDAQTVRYSAAYSDDISLIKEIVRHILNILLLFLSLSTGGDVLVTCSGLCNRYGILFN
jgi:hypothetical protein